MGTPLTHRHFLRRHNGTYGPAIRAGQGTFPGPSTPIPGQSACIDFMIFLEFLFDNLLEASNEVAAIESFTFLLW